MPTMPDPETTYSGPGGPGRVHVVVSPAQAADLAAWLLSPHRTDEVVVVAHSAAEIDPAHLAVLAAPSREVYTVAQRSPSHGSLTGELSRHLPANTAVFGNAARLYPAEPSWQTAPSQAPFFPYNQPEELSRFAERLARPARQARRPRPSSPRHHAQGVSRAPTASVPAAPTPTASVPAAPTPTAAAAPTGPGTAQPGHAAPGGTAGRPTGAAGSAPNSGDGAFSATGVVHRVDTVPGGRGLAQHLIDPHRHYPTVVLSIDPGSQDPYFDADRIAHELRGVATVVRIGADATYGLTAGLGDKRWSVFYGAGRVYPVGTDWLRDMHRAPLHLCFSPSMALRATPAILEEALVAAHTAGVLRPPAASPQSVAVNAEVRGTLGDLYIQVRTDDGHAAAMLAAHLRVGVPADRLVRSRQVFHGRFTATSGILGEFVPDTTADDAAARARECLPSGSLTLARIDSVVDGAAVALLHPDVPVQIVDTFDEDAALVLSRGEVVGVEVVWDEGQVLGALLPDPEPSDLVPGMPILPGGPPWLLPADLAPDAPASADNQSEETAQQVGAGSAPATPRTQPPSQQFAPSAADSLRRIAELREINAVLAGEAEAARVRIDQLEAQMRDLRRQLRRTAGKRTTRSVGPVWRDPERQLRHEVALAFLERVPEDQRDDHPLSSSYVVGPDFIESLERLQGMSRAKVLRIAVECVTGLDKATPARKRRPWLAYSGGPQERRADGASAWRVNLQDKSAAARRLKYWLLADGRIELDSVGGHDEGLRSRRARS